MDWKLPFNWKVKISEAVAHETNSMELGPSQEATSWQATQYLPSILWNPKVHYHVHMRPPLVPILSWISPVHTTASYLSKILMYFPPVSCVHLTSPHLCYMPCPSHSLWLQHSNYTWWSVQVLNLHIMQLSLEHPVTSSFLGLSILP
jgi:hypothetical protein